MTRSLRKDLHIAKILENPAVALRWQAEKGHPPNAEDAKAMFELFVPEQLKCLRQYAALLPGTVEAVQQLRSMGMKIGMTTGFTKVMVDVLLDEAGKHGFHPDTCGE